MLSGLMICVGLLLVQVVGNNGKVIWEGDGEWIWGIVYQQQQGFCLKICQFVLLGGVISIICYYSYWWWGVVENGS